VGSLYLEGKPRRRFVLPFLAALSVLLGIGGAPAYSDEMGGEAYREQDTLPGRYHLYRQNQAEAAGLWGLGPGQGLPSRSRFKIDAHEGVSHYSPRRPCVDCHEEHKKELHRARMGIACVQCHTDKPVIAGVQHYYSPMNPLRRHAYVCAKCHEGATPSFASYVVHEPNPFSAATREEFPLLFYAAWFMAILAGGVFALFLPFTALWCMREWLSKRFGRETGHG